MATDINQAAPEAGGVIAEARSYVGGIPVAERRTADDFILRLADLAERQASEIAHLEHCRTTLVATQMEEIALIGVARDCERQEWASALSTKDAENARLRGALQTTSDAIAEYRRYQFGGDGKRGGSYDGKPERDGLWRAHTAANIALNPTKGAGA